MENSRLFAYLAEVQRMSEIDIAACAAASAERNKPLHDKIQDWWLTLSPSDQHREYTMAELVQRFKTSSGLLGTALQQLGWHRRRNYQGTGTHGSYWFAGMM